MLLTAVILILTACASTPVQRPESPGLQQYRIDVGYHTAKADTITHSAAFQNIRESFQINVGPIRGVDVEFFDFWQKVAVAIDQKRVLPANGYADIQAKGAALSGKTAQQATQSTNDGSGLVAAVMLFTAIATGYNQGLQQRPLAQPYVPSAPQRTTGINVPQSQKLVNCISREVGSQIMTTCY